MDYRLTTSKDMSPEQLVIARRDALLWAKRWERCEHCNQYIRESVPSWAKCAKPEKHGERR